MRDFGGVKWLLTERRSVRAHRIDWFVAKKDTASMNLGRLSIRFYKGVDWIYMCS